MIFDLPTTVEFCGKSWKIRTDFRDVLTILEAFEDPDLQDGDKAYICLHNLYIDFDSIPQSDYQAAYDAAMNFIDHGTGDKKQTKKTMDWTQDAPLIFSAVNAVAGFETRAVDYIHWWTFTGWFMEIHDTVYSTVLNLRQKQAQGKKLEKHEREFWKRNIEICKIKHRESQEEREEKARLEKMLG